MKLPRRPMSTLPLDCLSLDSGDDCEGCFICLGVSGLFNALSNQLALVGLQRLASIVLEDKGVPGLEPAFWSSQPNALEDLACRDVGFLVGLSSFRVGLPLDGAGGVAGRSFSFVF